jgi:histidinol-phosphate/aromatic aminotransferase/cobyric acid decarboxylase-like protein
VAEFKFDPEGRRSLLEEAQGGFWPLDVLDFCFLRNMYWPTPAMFSEMRRNLPSLLQNYGSSQVLLDRKLAWWLRCAEERVILVSGLSQVFPLLDALVPAAKVLVPTPTFGEYQRAFPNAAKYVDNFNTTLADVEARMLQVSADLVVLVTPNNPTGTVLPARGIMELAKKYPECTFVVDESFQGFSSEPSVIELLEQDPLENILVLVSLSKTMGVPGARLGHVYTCRRTSLAMLRERTPVWNINSVAEHLLEIALKHRSTWGESLVRTRKDRADFAQWLAALPQIERVVEGGGNFLAVRPNATYAPERGWVNAFLEQHCIYLKDVTHKIADGHTWLRIAVRTPGENRRLTALMTELPRAMA